MKKNLKFITLGNTRNYLVSCLYENRVLTRKILIEYKHALTVMS